MTNLQLPKSWEAIALSDLAALTIGGDWGKDADYDDPEFVRVLCIRGSEFRNWDVDKGSTASLRKVKKSSLENRVLVNGDILVEISGGGPEQPVGRTVLIDKTVLSFSKDTPKICTNFLRLLRTTGNIDSSFLNQYLTFFYRTGKIRDYQGGSNNLRNLRFNDYLEINIPLPPLSEQHRIVAKIEALFSELDKGIENFKTAREQLKIYRQALLKQAFSGKLTEQWRVENPDKLENADALLQRIQTERQQRYQQQLKDWEAGSKQGSKPKALKTLPPLTAEELAELPELPNEWEYAYLLNLIMEVADVDHKMPKAQRDGIPYISTKDFFDQESINYEMAKRISQDDYLSLCKKIKPEYSDLLLSRYGTVGEVRKVNYEDVFQASYSIAIIKTLKNRPEFIDYLKWGFRAEVIQKQIRKYVRATAQPDLGLVHIRQLAIPVPALEEQTRIIEILEASLSEVDQLDQTITSALQQAEALRQSILKKAFSGQLVPQDPNDEPASVLLERIQAEKAAQALQTKPNKTQKRKATA